MNAIRERMVQFGASSLSDLEVLAMMIGVDTDVAQGVLDAVGSLHGLHGRRVAELSSLPNMTDARADRLLAAVELGKRSIRRPDMGEPLGTGSAVAERYQRLATETTEQFMAVAVNARLRATGEWVVARGWESGVNLTVKQVMTLLVKENVSRVIFIHCHPSGDPTPSNDDIRFTGKLIEAARTLEIKVLDHIVIASGGHASLRESCRGELEFG